MPGAKGSAAIAKSSQAEGGGARGAADARHGKPENAPTLPDGTAWNDRLGAETPENVAGATRMRPWRARRQRGQYSETAAEKRWLAPASTHVEVDTGQSAGAWTAVAWSAGPAKRANRPANATSRNVVCFATIKKLDHRG